MIRAAILGAVIATLGLFLLIFAHGALFGASKLWDPNTAYGWQGGVNAVEALVVLSILFWPLLPSVAAVGAGVGALLHGLTRTYGPRRLQQVGGGGPGKWA